MVAPRMSAIGGRLSRETSGQSCGNLNERSGAGTKNLQSSGLPAARFKTVQLAVWPTKFCVYEMRDRKGNVLYIGFTLNPQKRLSTHLRTGRFPKGSLLVPVSWHGDVLSVREAERALIQAKRPPMNKLCNQMPDDEARAIWFSDPHEPKRIVLGRMDDWSEDMALMRFGPRS
jgi:predicted GIY-YIG superfamily endonuclease